MTIRPETRPKEKLLNTSKSQTQTKKKYMIPYLVIYFQLHPVQHSESQETHYIWEVHSANKLDTHKTSLLQQTLVFKIIPIRLQDNTGLLVIQPTLQTLNALCCEVDFNLPHSQENPLPLQGNNSVQRSIPATRRDPGQHVFLKGWILWYKNKQTSFPLAKCFIFNGFSFINTD